MSIGKAQAQALAEGFLNTVGDGDADGIVPRDLLTEFFLLAGEFVEDAQENLKKSNSIGSGSLSESLKANHPEVSGHVVSVDIMMNFYGQFINKGVKGTKSGSGMYAFKYSNASKKMADAIREWLKAGKLGSTNVKKQHSVSRHEKKSVSIGQIDAAWAVATSIKQHGIKPTGFLDKAIITTQSKVQDRLGAALKVDIINSITK